MTLSFDPGEDLAQVADSLEAVTLTRPGSSVAVVVSRALRLAVSDRLIAESAGRFALSDVAWHLPAAEVPVEPQAGDVIVDAKDRRWTVLDVEKKSLGTRWRCVARNLAVVHGLDAYVDVEKAVVSKGPSGAEKLRWQTWKTGLSARIQPIETEIRSEHDRQVTQTRFRIFLAQYVALDRGHRVRGPDALLEIDAVRVG
jgi:hypothetical protein